MSGLVPRGNDAEQAKLSNLPWLEGSAAGPSQCVPDEDLELEWIHGYSAQVGDESHELSMSEVYLTLLDHSHRRSGREIASKRSALQQRIGPGFSVCVILSAILRFSAVSWH